MISFIQEHGLHAGPQRKLSFFSMTSVTRGYTTHLRPHLGFSYEVVGAMVEGDQTLSIVNDAVVARKVQQFLEQHPKKLDEHIFPSTKQFLHQYNTPSSLKQYANLHNILSFYPLYFGIIGIYNALNRYVKETSHELLTDDQLQKIGHLRNELGGMYPIIDIELIRQFDQSPHGRLLGFLTFGEMEPFLKNGTLPKNLADRPNGCIYLYVEDTNKEHIITEPKTVAECKRLLYPQFDSNAAEIKGQSIFPGKVSGTVAIVPRDTPLPADAVIITSMTTVNETHLISQARAVVADEGGILCHAAVIAREMGKPCIVGTKFGSKILKEGDKVEVDATNGTIYRIKTGSA